MPISLHTWANQEQITDVKLNRMEDNADQLGNPPMCILRHNANQSIGSSATITLLWDTELKDPWLMHSTVSNTGRINIPTGEDGQYFFWCAVQLPVSTAGMWRLDARQNAGATLVGRAYLDSDDTNTLQLGVYLDLAAADYIYFELTNPIASAYTVVTAGAHTPRCGCHKISEGGDGP